MRGKQRREVVYVERGGDSSAKWLFWGALLGAGLALLYAPSSGEETRRNLQRKLWKLRAMTEEKLDELTQQFGGAKDIARGPAGGRGRGTSRATASARGFYGRSSAGRRPGKSSSGVWRMPARAGGHPLTSRSRSPERLRPGGWHRSPAGFLRRTLQAADEDNIPFLASALTFDALLAAVPFVLLLLIGLTHLAQAVTHGPPVDTVHLFHRFLPPHSTAAGPRPLRRHRAASDRHHPEPRAALALRGARLPLVQHPSLCRDPDLAQRHLRRVAPAHPAPRIHLCCTSWPSCATR